MKTPPYENLIWDSAEIMDHEQRKVLQLRRLKETVSRVMNVPLYRDKLKASGVTPESIKSLDDIRRLPITTKEDLRLHYPLGYLTVPQDQILRIHGSSGTTGKPVLVAYTRKDLEMWSGLCARFLTAGGLLPRHLVQVSFGYGLFTGGFGLHYGIERVGAGILPAAAGNTPRQLMFIQDLKPDVLIATPSYALNIGEVARDMGIKPGELSLKYAHFGGEPWTDEMRRTIEEQLGIMAFNNYGLSELIGPSVSGECYVQKGMHIQEDMFYVECLDPDTLEPVPEGEPGELVITNLKREAMSVLRYRTRDIAILDRSPCPCGRTTMRMGRVIGRSDDMLIIRGVNVFPSQIEEALLKVEGVAPYFQIEVTRPGALDEVTVHVEILPSYFSDKMSDMDVLRHRIMQEIHVITGLHMKLNMVAPNTLERFTGKAKRVTDHRKLCD